MSLALATVIYEWRRYLAAVVALAFSGLLVLAQVGMFVGIGKAFTATIDRSRGDLMILPAKSESLMNTGGLPWQTHGLGTVFAWRSGFAYLGFQGCLLAGAVACQSTSWFVT